MKTPVTALTQSQRSTVNAIGAVLLLCTLTATRRPTTHERNTQPSNGQASSTTNGSGGPAVFDSCDRDDRTDTSKVAAAIKAVARKGVVITGGAT